RLNGWWGPALEVAHLFLRHWRPMTCRSDRADSPSIALLGHDNSAASWYNNTIDLCGAAEPGSHDGPVRMSGRSGRDWQPRRHSVPLAAHDASRRWAGMRDEKGKPMGA